MFDLEYFINQFEDYISNPIYEGRDAMIVGWYGIDEPVGKLFLDYLVEHGHQYFYSEDLTAHTKSGTLIIRPNYKINYNWKLFTLEMKEKPRAKY